MTDLFKHKASEFDSNPIPQQLSAGIGACMLDNVPLSEALAVMDFGAGTGLITAQVASRVGRVTCVDISQSMLERLAAKEALQGKVEIVCQDILTQPLDQQFDLIVSAMAMHHIEDTGLLMRQLARHLRHGGRVALADLDEEDGSFHPENTEGVYHAGFNREKLREILERSGFGDVRFFDAHSVAREGREYPVFLVLATKP